MHAHVPGLPVLDWCYLKRTASPHSITAMFEAPFRLWTTSGRAAIALALMNAGLGPGDRILLPTYHCPTMVSPARYLGLDTEFFPLAANGAADLEFIARQFESGRIRAILLAHYFGFPQPIRALRDLCDKHRIVLIEDCAHAMFGSADGRPMGSWGDYATGSLTKFLPVTLGGCLVSHRHSLGEHMRYQASFDIRLKNRLDAVELATRYGRLAGIGPALGMLFDVKNLVRGTPRSTASLDPITRPSEDNVVFHFDKRRMLTAPPRYISRIAENVDRKRIVERRRRAYERLARAIAPLPGIRLAHRSLPDTVAPYVFPILSDRPDETFRRARQRGIPVFRWNWLWPNTPVREGDVGMCWSRNLLQLPCHQDLTDREIERIVQAMETAESNA